MKINMELARSRGLDAAAIKRINEIYKKLESIFEAQRKILNGKIEVAETVLEQWDSEVRVLEFELQEAWGFERNEKWHHYWFKQPLCTCPKVDNYERLGTGMFIVSNSCPLHKRFVKEQRREK